MELFKEFEAMETRTGKVAKTTSRGLVASESMDVENLLPIEPVEISVLVHSAETTISHDVYKFFENLGLKFSLESEDFADSRFPIDGNTNSEIPFRIRNHCVHELPSPVSPDVAVCFYPSEISKDLAVEFSELSFQSNKKVPVLFVGIKADGTISTSILPADSERSPGNPNVNEYMEWSVESGEMEAKQIFEKAVCMGFRHVYFSIISRAVEEFHLQYKDLELLERENILSPNSLMDTIPILCRLWELRRIILTYRSDVAIFLLAFLEFRPMECRSGCTIVYRNISDWLPDQESTLDVKPSFYLFPAEVGAISDLLSTSTNYPVSLTFYQKECNFITQVFQNQTAQLNVRSLVIIQCFGSLKLQFLSSLKTLEHLVIIDTEVDPTNLVFTSKLCESIKHLVLARCRITEVPEAIGTLINLTVLNINANSITKLPGILGNLRKLETFLFDFDTIKFPPINVLRRNIQDIMKYLQAFEEDDEAVPHNEAKLIVVGQERVGKSTLIKAMRRDVWIKHVNKPPDKTDGIDISTLKLGGTRFKVYDMGGDVEYLNTHSLFLSSDCLHLAVFDMSQITVSKATRSADQFCRLELWLQMIAAQNPESYVIIVGTHADGPRIRTEMIASIRKQLLQLLGKYQHSQQQRFDGCIVCKPEELPENLQGTYVESSNLTSPGSCIPHVLGYFEVSSTTKYPRAPLSVKNKNLDELRSVVSSTNATISKLHGQIPKKWLAFYKSISYQKVEPTMPLTNIYRIAKESEVSPDMVESMLRFFHSQGNLLWYEDIPEMKDVVIMKPQWLSDQLRTLISYRPSVDTICDGILHTASLSEVWADISEVTRPKLLSLFRSAGLCFSISDVEELFPCNLPIGWPNREKWSPLPKNDENQTSLLFTFSFLPPTFFTRLIVEVNKKRQSFPSSLQPLYYRFHILYVTKEQERCDAHEKQPQAVGEDTFPQACLHTVHYEVMPYNNSIKVSIRGSSPCCIVSSIWSAMESVQSLYYPGINFDMRLICPICEMKKVHIPATFNVDSSNHEGICSKGWHKVGSINDILRGKYSPGDFVASELHQATRIGGEILKDHICPKLFVVLPINLECLSFKDRLVHSYLRDGYAVHLLCECPDQWHFVDSPGFRIGKPKEFFEKYGNHLCRVLRTIAKLGVTLRAVSAVAPAIKNVTASLTIVASKANLVAHELEGLLDNAFEKYPYLKSAPDSTDDDLENLQSAVDLQRGELAKFLEVVDKDHQFGPLVCTYVDKRNAWLWLCRDHKKNFDIVKH